MVAVWPPRSVVMSRAAMSLPTGASGLPGMACCDVAVDARNKQRRNDVAAGDRIMVVRFPAARTKILSQRKACDVVRLGTAAARWMAAGRTALPTPWV